MATAQEQKELLNLLERRDKLRARAAEADRMKAQRPAREKLRREIEYAPIGTSKKPIPLKGAAKLADDLIRGAADAMTLGFADEIAAAAETISEGSVPSPSDILRPMPDVVYAEDLSPYERNLQQQRRRDQEMDPLASITGGLLGGGLLGTGVARSGRSLVANAAPRASSIVPRTMAESALYGGAYGAGSGEGATDRLRGAAIGGVMGGALGALAGGGAAMQNNLRMAEHWKATSQELKNQSRRLYDTAATLDVQISPDDFAQGVKDIAQGMRKEGFRPALHTRTSAAMREFAEEAGKEGPVSFADIDQLRKIARDAAQSMEPRDRYMGQALIEQFDEWLDTVPDSAVIGGASKAADLKAARKLWQQGKMAELFDDIMDRAEIRAGQYSQSGMENALRTEFRTLSRNPRAMRNFTKEQQKQIKDIAKGSFSGDVLRWIGRFSPRGIISTGITGGGSAAAAAAAGLPVVPVAAGAAGVAAGGQALATQKVMRDVNRTFNSMLPNYAPTGVHPNTPIVGGGLSALAGRAGAALTDNPPPEPEAPLGLLYPEDPRFKR